MSPCFGVLSPYAWTPNNKVGCDLNQPKEQFLISFHLEFHFLGISHHVICVFQDQKSHWDNSNSYHTVIVFIWDSAQVSTLNYLHFSLIADVFQQETCQLLTWLGELRGRARSTAACQLSGWLLSTREWVTAAVTTAPPLILVSNILRWKEAKNPAGLRFGSGLLSRFLPLMAAMYFLRYTPFPPQFCTEAAITQLWQNGSPSNAQHYHCHATHLCVCRTRLIKQWFLIAVVLCYKHHARP